MLYWFVITEQLVMIFFKTDKQNMTAIIVGLGLIEQIMCLNRGRSKGEDCGHVKSV